MICIYCRHDKPQNSFTLEHIIPQFLGGTYAPETFKTRDVCATCNNNLGLFVDAGFEKNWLVYNRLTDAAYAFFDPNIPEGLPLRCMGNSALVPPQIEVGEACECWIGPLGEQVYWVRPHDERLYWYAGGNPRTAKNIESRAYFLFSERTQKNPNISWLAFRDAFEGRRVRKILCTKIEGADPATIGFSEPDQLDVNRISYFNYVCTTQTERKNSIAFNTQFDFRFLAKICLGVSYALFGHKILHTEYSNELYKALWFRDGDTPPLLNGKTAFTGGNDDFFKDITGHEYGVVLTISTAPRGVALTINIGKALCWSVMCSSYEKTNSADIARIGDGIVVVLFKQLKRSVSLSLPRYIAHKSGVAVNTELNRIGLMANRNKDYLKNILHS